MMIHKKFEGKKWVIYYVSINNFVDDLAKLGEVLDELSRDRRIVSIIPNIGLTKTSTLFGTSFQGVKGLAIIVEKQ